MNAQNKPRMRDILLLHGMLLVYSVGGIFSKLASAEEFLSPKFVIFYGLVVANLGVYAILWQQLLKKLPLITAYANKAVLVVWGMLWGWLIFREAITLQMIIGAVVIMVGIYLVVTADE